MKRQNTWLPDPDYEALKELAQKRDLPVPHLIRKAVSDFVEKAKKAGDL